MRYQCILLLTCLVVLGVASKYRATSVNQNGSSVVIALTYTGSDTYYVKPTSPIIKKLLFTVTCHTNTDLSFKIVDAEKARYEVPQTGVFPIDPAATFTYPLNNSQFVFNFTESPFDFSIRRKFDN